MTHKNWLRSIVDDVEVFFMITFLITRIVPNRRRFGHVNAVLAGRRLMGEGAVGGGVVLE